MRKTDQALPFGEIAARVLAGLEVEDRFLDDTGRPLSIGDFVQIMDSQHHAGLFAEVVGLDIFNDNGDESGDNVVFVRLTDTTGEPRRSALVMTHPTRLRYLRKVS